MKFKNYFKQPLGNLPNKSNFAIRKSCLYLLILAPLVANPLVIDGLTQRFSDRQTSQEKYSMYLLSTAVFGFLSYVGARKLAQKPLLESTQPSSKQLDSVNHDVLTPETDKKKDIASYTLLAEMSHELRSPLNAILGFAQIIEQEKSTAEVNRENIAIINRSGANLLSVINDIVDLAKIETNQLTLERNHIDFQEWLDNLEQSFKFKARNQGWEFSLIRQPNLPQCICIDERRLRHILRNLVDYCLKAQSTANTGNDVSITVTSKSPLGKTLQNDQSLKIHNICFAVENPNCLITPTELATLFDPTARVQQHSTEGSSLSIPISRKVAQLMGGDIVVCDQDSESGRIFNLEIQTESVPAQKLQIQSYLRRIIGLESNQTEYRILVVDDSKTNRKIMVTLLEPVGFKVKEAVNGKEAIDVWLSWQPHMIWMDLRMPVMNGYEATEQIKSYSQAAHTPIVALTASSLEEERLLFQAAGCDDFVGKPFSENIIFDKIAQHLDLRYVYEESIDPIVTSNFKLSADSLNVMPHNWLEQVEAAAMVLDQELLTQLLQQIPVEHVDLKNALQKQVNNFDFDQIINLAKNSNKE